MAGQDEPTLPVLRRALRIDDSTRNKFARHGESVPPENLGGDAKRGRGLGLPSQA
jgi:hypothetical protein